MKQIKKNMITSNNALMLDKLSGGGRNSFLDFLKVESCVTLTFHISLFVLLAN